MEIDGGTHKLTDLCDEHGRISGVQAHGATFTGPAVIFRERVQMHHCSFDDSGGGPEAFVWEIDPARTRIVGAVHVLDSKFEHCEFTNIGIAGTAAQVNELFQAINLD